MILYLDLSQVFALYDEVTRVSGGAYGLRDLGYLESALHQPQQTFAGNDVYLSLAEKAAAFGYALIMNHPFVDGNKRMGSLLWIYFLFSMVIFWIRLKMMPFQPSFRLQKVR